jgi:hypothetical protein
MVNAEHLAGSKMGLNFDVGPALLQSVHDLTDGGGGSMGLREQRYMAFLVGQAR